VGEGLVSDTRQMVADTLTHLFYLLFENAQSPTDKHELTRVNRATAIRRSVS
jgi:hypothetical protein